jgi:hypothetical protein
MYNNAMTDFAEKETPGNSLHSVDILSTALPDEVIQDAVERQVQECNDVINFLTTADRQRWLAIRMAEAEKDGFLDLSRVKDTIVSMRDSGLNNEEIIETVTKRKDNLSPLLNVEERPVRRTLTWPGVGFIMRRFFTS